MRFTGGLVTALAILAIAGVVYIYSGLFDVAASSPHSGIGRWILSTTMARSVVSGAASIDEPPPFTEDMIKDGFEHFDEMCTICHGGPGLERTEIGKGLNPRAPDLSRAVKDWTPRQLFWIVKHGVKMTGMPAFGATHDDNEVWSIVAFIEKLPGMTSQQYQQMKREAAGHTHEPERRH